MNLEGDHYRLIGLTPDGHARACVNCFDSVLNIYCSAAYIPVNRKIEVVVVWRLMKLLPLHWVDRTASPTSSWKDYIDFAGRVAATLSPRQDDEGHDDQHFR